MKKGLNKQRGGALIGLIFVVVLVAAMYFGSSFFLQKENSSEKSLKLLKEAQERAGDLNDKIKENNTVITEQLKTEVASVTPVEITEMEITNEEIPEIISESDLGQNTWQELVRENEGIKIKFHKDWYYTINRIEAIQNGYYMIVGFDTDENISEEMPPFKIELVIASENMKDDYQAYVKELGVKNGKKYILRTEDQGSYGELIDSMATTFEFIDKTE